MLKNNEPDSIFIDSLLLVGKKLNDTEPVRAIRTFEKAQNLANSIDYKQGVLAAMNGLGNSYIFMGIYDKALEHHLPLLNKSLELQDQSHEFKALGNIAITYANLLDYDKSLIYFRKSLSLAEKTNHPLYGSICANIGNLFKIINEFDSALHYLNLAIEAGLQTKNNRTLAHGLFNLSDVEVNLGRYEDALYHIDSAIACGKLIDSEIFLINGKISKAEVLFHMKRGVEQISSLKENLKLAEEKSFYQSLITGYRILSDIYQQMGLTEEAFEAYKKGKKWEKEVFNSEKSKQIEMLTAQFELEAKQREIDIQSLTLTKQKYFIYAVSSIALITIFIAIILLRYFIHKSRANRALKTLNKKITKRQEELIYKSNILKKANEEINHINDNLEQMIAERTQKINDQNVKLLNYAFLSAHEIRGPLSTILGLTKMLKENPNDEILINTITQLYEKAEDMDFVIKKMVTSLEEEIEMRPFNKKPTI